jgi:hypothetical protein
MHSCRGTHLLLKTMKYSARMQGHTSAILRSEWPLPEGQADAQTSPITHRIEVSVVGDAQAFTERDWPAAWLMSSTADASRSVPAQSTCRNGQIGCCTVSHSCRVLTMVWRVAREGVTTEGGRSNVCTSKLICRKVVSMTSNPARQLNESQRLVSCVCV